MQSNGSILPLVHLLILPFASSAQSIYPISAIISWMSSELSALNTRRQRTPSLALCKQLNKQASIASPKSLQMRRAPWWTCATLMSSMERLKVSLKGWSMAGLSMAPLAKTHFSPSLLPSWCLVQRASVLILSLLLSRLPAHPQLSTDLRFHVIVSSKGCYIKTQPVAVAGPLRLLTAALAFPVLTLMPRLPVDGCQVAHASDLHVLQLAMSATAVVSHPHTHASRMVCGRDHCRAQVISRCSQLSNLSVDSCQPIVGSITNGQISSSIQSLGGVSTFSCDSGFYLVGASTSVCQAGGVWSVSTLPVCQRRFSEFSSTHSIAVHMLTGSFLPPAHCARQCQRHHACHTHNGSCCRLHLRFWVGV